MSYICVKKLTLSGNRYLPGDIIPEDAFLDGSAAKLIKFGYVTAADTEDDTNTEAEETPEAIFYVNFAEGEENVLAVPVDADQLQTIADIMQKTAGDATNCIEELEDDSVLIFVMKTDSRKSVRDAAQKRLNSLNNLPSSDGRDKSRGN